MDKRQHNVNMMIQPSRGLVDEKFTILVNNTVPGFHLTIHAIHQCEEGYNWEAFGHYLADTTGSVNVSEDPSLGGTYSGVEQMGLLWSLRPVPGSVPGLRLSRVNVETPMEIKISVYQGHQTEGFMDQVPMASTMVERWYMAPGVRRVPITENGLTATLFLPPGPGPFPGILDLWGGVRGMVEYRAALLASHGIAALALEYRTSKIIQKTGKTVDNKYFEAAYRVLKQHPRVLGNRIGMLGLCFGAVVTLKMAVYSDVFELRCAVCVNGSHVQPINGSMEQIMSFFSRNAAKIRVSEENVSIWRDVLLPIPDDPALKVDVGRLRCPLLLVVGEDDQNVCAHESAIDMKDMMEQAGNSHLLTIASYPNTGHMIEPPYLPHVRASILKIPNSHQFVTAVFGGETVAHCRAQEDAWRKTLDFLREHLWSGRKPSTAFLSHL